MNQSNLFLADSRFSRISGRSPFLTELFTNMSPVGVLMKSSGDRLRTQKQFSQCLVYVMQRSLWQTRGLLEVIIWTDEPKTVVSFGHRHRTHVCKVFKLSSSILLSKQQPLLAWMHHIEFQVSTSVA